MKDFWAMLLFWFLFDTDQDVVEPLEALGADLTALELELDDLDCCDV